MYDVVTVDRQPIQALLERLLSNVVDFWDQRAIDLDDGGYRVNFSPAGRWRGRSDKFLVSQARMLWYFSRLASSKYGTSAHLASARHGWDFLRARMWDSEYGGFYWRVRPGDGKILQSDKHLYGQAFALFAISEYAMADQSSEAYDSAGQLYALLDERAYDDEHGGYGEYFLRDWVLPTTGTGYLDHGPCVKSLNTHLHLLEAIMRYSKVAAKPAIFDRLRELVQIFNEKAVRIDPKVGACGIERHTATWTPFDTPADRCASYGHDVELAWLLSDACTVLGISASKVPRQLLDHALRFGYDARDGGFFESGDFGHPAERRRKVWWVQAEGLLSLIKMYESTGETKYLNSFLQTLNWIVERQVDWKSGEWYPFVDERGRGSGDKGGNWKTPYHEARSILECMETLERL